MFAAQVEFRDIPDVKVLPIGYRYYPYGSVGRADHRLGRARPGAKTRSCSRTIPLPAISATRSAAARTASSTSARPFSAAAGESWSTTSTDQLVRETETQFGRDVQLTLDIELQKRIEDCLVNPEINPLYSRAPMAAAVIDVGSGRHPGPGVAADLRSESRPVHLRRSADRPEPPHDQPGHQRSLSPGIGGQAADPDRRPGVGARDAGGGHQLPQPWRSPRPPNCLDLQDSSA